MKRQRIAAVMAALLIGGTAGGSVVPEQAMAAAVIAAPTNVILNPDRTVTWTNVPNNIGYVVYVYDASNNARVGSRQAAANATSLKIDELLTKTGRYYVRIVTYAPQYDGNSIESVRSNELEVAVKVTLSAPESVELTTDGLVKWKAGSNQGFLINVYHSPSNTLVTSQTTAKDAFTANIAKWVPGTGEYYVKVIARGDGATMNDSRESAPSGVFKIVKAAALQPPADVVLSYDQIVTWKGVEANNGYRVTVYNADTDEIVGFAQAEKDAVSLDVSHLANKSGRYYAKVQAIGDKENSSEDSQKSATRTFELAEHQFAVPEELLKTESITQDDGAATAVTVNTDGVLAALGKRPANYHLQVRTSKTGNPHVYVSGRVLERMKSLNENAELRVITDIGLVTLPVKKLQEMARNHAFSLGDHTLELAFDQQSALKIRIPDAAPVAEPPSKETPQGELPQEATQPRYEVREFRGISSIPVKFSLNLTDAGRKIVTSLDETGEYVAVRIPLPSTLVPADIMKLGGVRIDDDARNHPVPLRVEEKNGQLTAVFHYQGTSRFAVTKTELNFPDVEETHYAKTSIGVLSAKAVINGFEDGTFRPKDTVTRAEFATMLVRALGLKDKSELGAPGFFSDVKEDAWFAGVVNTAFRSGLISGKGEGKFAPQDLITEQEMAAMVFRALKFAGYDTSLPAATQGELLGQLAKSSDISDWAKTSVALCFQQGILSGPTLAKFDPARSADRGMAADMLYRMLKPLRFTN